MFSLLCRAEAEDGSRFSDADIVDHMIFLMMAAHDTTTSTLTSLTYELAKHPEWQERVRRECQALGEAHLPYERMDDLDGSPPGAERDPAASYPPLSTIPRISTRAFEFGGFRIPANKMVCALAAPYPLHEGVVDGAPALRSRALRAGARGAQEAHPPVGPLQRRSPHVPRRPLRGDADPARCCTRWCRSYRWSVPDGYDDARAAGADLEADGRAPAGSSRCASASGAGLRRAGAPRSPVPARRGSRR
ncbi:MAG: cytochrome P450 [Chromatiales bacterium]|nr:cytochrome P450 [Chromatiales bacterium]